VAGFFAFGTCRTERLIEHALLPSINFILFPSRFPHRRLQLALTSAGWMTQRDIRNNPQKNAQEHACLAARHAPSD
jgi:hypothetical protein